MNIYHKTLLMIEICAFRLGILLVQALQALKHGAGVRNVESGACG